MKNLITIINLSIIIGITTIFTQSDNAQNGSSTPADKEASGYHAKVNDAIKSDVIAVAPSSKKSLVNEAVEEFLQEMTEARLMDLEEGKIAQQRGTTRSLKDYGSLMIKDQSKMLDELKKIANLKKVTVPTWLGPDQAEGLEDLRKAHGKSFDKKFIKMMIIDHKRDIKKLEQAIHSRDADIQIFATKYLPTVQSHLDQIMALKN
jgi:putative membrane protein